MIMSSNKFFSENSTVQFSCMKKVNVHLKDVYLKVDKMWVQNTYGMTELYTMYFGLRG